MGWTYFRPTPGKPTLDILKEEMPSLTFHETALVGRTFYAACTHPKVAGTFGLVVLIDRRGGQFGYKDMDEQMGPYEHDCPARVLDKLSDPPPNDYAAQWRARCRQAAAQLDAELLRLAEREHETGFFECGGTFDGFACGSDADPGL